MKKFLLSILTLLLILIPLIIIRLLETKYNIPLFYHIVCFAGGWYSTDMRKYLFKI